MVWCKRLGAKNIPLAALVAVGKYKNPTSREAALFVAICAATNLKGRSPRLAAAVAADICYRNKSGNIYQMVARHPLWEESCMKDNIRIADIIEKAVTAHSAVYSKINRRCGGGSIAEAILRKVK